jgi:hypothetical protein
MDYKYQEMGSFTPFRLISFPAILVPTLQLCSDSSDSEFFQSEQVSTSQVAESAKLTSAVPTGDRPFQRFLCRSSIMFLTLAAIPVNENALADGIKARGNGCPWNPLFPLQIFPSPRYQATTID